MNLINLLRSATGELHKRLDSSPWVEVATTSREGYADYLQRFQSGFLKCELQVDWHAMEQLRIPDGGMRRGRYERLANDLVALGRPKRGKRDPDGAGSATPGSSVGSLYVLEGSIHGGKHMLAALEKKVGEISEEESGFFRGFGERTAGSWREFVNWLDHLAFDENFEKEATAAAVRSFEYFIDALEVPGSTTSTPSPLA